MVQYPARVPLLLLLLFLLPGVGSAERAEEEGKAVQCRNFDPLRRPFFGDLHVHTRHSLDASTQGTRTTPRQAYAFAQGEALGIQPFGPDGEPERFVALKRPLDFAAVTDHAELFGEVATCNDPALPGYDSLVCRVYRGWPRMAFFLMNGRGAERFSFCGENGEVCEAAARGPWLEIQEAAEEAQDRSPDCRFSSFVGYEWTKTVGTAANLHRNVIFRNATVSETPADALRTPTPEALWDALDADCRELGKGCDALVIPHNSNLSAGNMFIPERLADHEPYDRDEARRRAYNEPLVEIMQHKGDSECSVQAGNEDEACAFEKLPYDSFMGRFLTLGRSAPGASNFVRDALGQGLVLGQSLGANPFEFGVIGSTDTHLGTPGLVAEKGYPGHGGAGVPVGEVLPDMLLDPIEYNPGGLAVLWAEENRRESLFRAMRRRETYATSGPRISLRVFAGYELPDDLCNTGDFARKGYASGVAMGGELPSPPTPGRAPALAVWALRDPGLPREPGTPLARLQVVKLSVEEGRVNERVLDIAGSAGQAGVDTYSCATWGTGHEQLCTVWRDPEFDASNPALYYARVLENPTCRWSTRVCNERGIDCRDPASVRDGYEACCDTNFPRSTQERAWSSPIWYTPES